MNVCIKEIADVIIDLDVYSCDDCYNCGKFEHGCECDDSCFSMKVAEALYASGFRKQVHGFWSYGMEDGSVFAKCSSCGRKMNFSCYGYCYCPLCGSRMDGLYIKEYIKEYNV